MNNVTIFRTVVALTLSGTLSGQTVDTAGTGWRLDRLDLNVTIHPGESQLTLRADLRVRLADHEKSSRIVLAMNSRDSIMAFDSVKVEGGGRVTINVRSADRPAMRQAFIDLPGPPVEAGQEVVIRVYGSSRTTAMQFNIAEDVALASWVTVWYPVPLPANGTTFGSAAKAPGSTNFDLPQGWRVVSNGVRGSLEHGDGRTRESWETSTPVARSFSAAPYTVTTGESQGRQVELFLLTVSADDAKEQAVTLARSISALERRFGPYPTGSYSIAEVPDWVPGFLASSEQGFMMAKAENFRVPGGNIPLFAHEAAHGYWGNMLTSSGPGSSFLSESIAQYGAVIALEEMLGDDAALEFLKFSREGYIPLQSAVGFFEVVRRGADSVAIADLNDLSGMAKRIVVDSKGTWIYQMLRHLVGDSVFFGTLRSYLASHSDGSSSLPTFRAAFADAAPDMDIDGFFSQWLDQTGAPRLETSWTLADGGVELVIEQAQPGGLYVLDLDVLLEGPSGTRQIHTVHLDSQRGVFKLTFPGRATAVTVDPAFRVLRWDESFRRERD